MRTALADRDLSQDKTFSRNTAQTLHTAHHLSPSIVNGGADGQFRNMQDAAPEVMRRANRAALLMEPVLLGK